jgi:hypothetical protein
MSQRALSVTAFVLGLCAVNAVFAHHPPLMDNCTALTFTGEVERIEWRNPHVELLVVADDGESHFMSWLNPQQLSRAGVDRDTIRAGDRVTVTVGTREDAVVPRPKLLAAITRLRDGWEWSQTPQGC